VIAWAAKCFSTKRWRQT